MATVAGVDCSTQSTKVVVCDADTGEVLAQRSAPHPEGTEVDPDAWAQAVGSVPVASFTVTKLRWLAEHEPELAGRVASVLLPHDWLTWRLTGEGEPVTDRGDASGTGYWSPRGDAYRTDLVELAFGRVPALPRVLPPAGAAGQTPEGAVVGAGTGDNMAAALGL